MNLRWNRLALPERTKKARRELLMTRIGVLSDTHGYLDTAIAEHFKGVQHIIHAGDIGMPSLLLELEAIAPVTAVIGNTDSELHYKETELLHLAGRKFLIQHIIDPIAPAEKLRRRIISEDPDVVVFGHSHRRFCQKIGRTLFLNPGYSGKQRFELDRSVALLHCDASEITATYLAL